MDYLSFRPALHYYIVLFLSVTTKYYSRQYCKYLGVLKTNFHATRQEGLH